jgi:hypothetical protein
MEIGNIIYKGTSDSEFLQSILLRAGFLIALAYLAFIYEQNPPIITVLMLICFLSFIYIGNDEIIIYADRVVQTDTSIVGLFLKSGKVIYELADIKSASLPQKPKPPGIFDVGLVILLLSILPKQRYHTTKAHFYLYLKHGKTISIYTSLGENKNKKIIEIINSLTTDQAPLPRL